MHSLVTKISALDFMQAVIIEQLAFQGDIPASLPFERLFAAHEASLDDLMCISCLLPWNVVAHLELLSNCFYDQVVISIPNIPGVTRLPLESFFVWM